MLSLACTLKSRPPSSAILRFPYIKTPKGGVRYSNWTGLTASDGHAAQPLQAAQVRYLAQVGEAVRQAHSADSVQHGHLTERLDRYLLLQRRFVKAGEVAFRSLRDGVHVGEEIVPGVDSQGLRVLEAHAGALADPVQAELLVPAAVQPDRGLVLENELDNVVFRPVVVPEHERDGAAVIVGAPVELIGGEVGDGVPVGAVELAQAAANEIESGHEGRLLSRRNLSPLARRVKAEAPDRRLAAAPSLTSGGPAGRMPW